MRKLVIKKNNVLIYAIGLSLLLIANICFFDVNTLSNLYVCAGLGIVLIFGHYLLHNNFRIKVESGLVYLTTVYGMIMIYGFFFNRYGTFNWDAILFNYVEYVAIYIAIRQLNSTIHNERVFHKTIVITVVITLLYILTMEFDNIILGSIRIGDSLAGNVNSVGMALGILSILLVYIYLCSENKRIFVLWVLTVLIMLLTGSKKTIFYLIADLFVLWKATKGNKKYSMIFIVVIVGISFYWIIMNVPLFYDVLGFRIEDMITQLFGNTSGIVSNSTDVRSKMIIEGFEIFQDYPIFGGGEKYFATQSRYGYAYSHCNYVELLCNYGIVGTIIYYVPYIYLLRRANKYKDLDDKKKALVIVLIIAELLMGWMAVLYTSYTSYIPIIICYIVLGGKNKKIPKRQGDEYNV